MIVSDLKNIMSVKQRALIYALSAGKILRGLWKMENPKLRIESDGIVTEVYIDGIKVEKATMAEFTEQIF